MMTFSRHEGERVDDLLTRFGIPWSRARQTGDLMIGREGLGYLLLRARGLSDNKLVMILHCYKVASPGVGARPLRACQRLRRLGHVWERAPGNLGSAARAGARAPAFMANEGGPREGDAQTL